MQSPVAVRRRTPRGSEVARGPRGAAEGNREIVSIDDTTARLESWHRAHPSAEVVVAASRPIRRCGVRTDFPAVTADLRSSLGR